MPNIDSGGEGNKENKEKGVITFPTLLTMIVAVTVKELCEFNEESRFDVNVPSLALQLGHSMKQCAQVLKKNQLCENNKDETAIRECQHFIDLFEAEWTIKISFRSLTSLGSKKQTKNINYVSQRMRQLARLL